MHGQAFLVAPHFQREDSFRSIEVADDSARAMPAGFLVEPRGSVVADRARQPGRPDAGRGEASLGVRNQGRGNALPARLFRHIKLIELVALQYRESDRRAARSRDACGGHEQRQPFTKILERSQPRQSRRDDSRVRVPPAVEPNPDKRIEVCLVRHSYFHELSVAVSPAWERIMRMRRVLVHLASPEGPCRNTWSRS